MQCPVCNNLSSETDILECSSCQLVVERRTYEQWQHLNFLLDWLKDNGEIIGPVGNQLIAEVAQCRDSQRLAMCAPVILDEEIRDELGLMKAAIDWLSKASQSCDHPFSLVLDLIDLFIQRAEEIDPHNVSRSLNIYDPTLLDVYEYMLDFLERHKEDGLGVSGEVEAFTEFVLEKKSELSRSLANEKAILNDLLVQIPKWLCECGHDSKLVNLVQDRINQKIHYIDTQLGGRILEYKSTEAFEVVEYAISLLETLVDNEGNYLYTDHCA